jgi:hypothetical protein
VAERLVQRRARAVRAQQMPHGDLGLNFRDAR